MSSRRQLRTSPGDATVLVDSTSTATMSRFHFDDIIASRFRILRLIGKGGMGDVYEAEDLQLNGRVALKTIRTEIPSTPQIVERFKREIVLAKKVTHPNVCRIYDLGFDWSSSGRSTPFLTMELLGGETLASRIRRGPIPEQEALPLIEDMLDALSAAHEAGIVLRDFKSSNVILVMKDRMRAVVTDFGLSCLHSTNPDGASLTNTGSVPGTVHYMSPEQLRGDEVTPAADLYSLGIVIYEMLTGSRPFVGPQMSVAVQQLNETPRPPTSAVPQLDPKWDDVILKCLEKSPDARFKSAHEMKAALSAIATRPDRQTSLKTHRYGVYLLLLVTILLTTLAWSVRALSLPGPSQHRVAVLAFEDIGGDASYDPLCNSLSDTLAGRLTEVKQFQNRLSIVPASELREQKVTSARDAQREFGVDLVITGSMQHNGAGARLIVNIIDARHLRQLRSSELLVFQTDPSAIEQGIMSQVVQLLDTELHTPIT